MDRRVKAISVAVIQKKNDSDLDSTGDFNAPPKVMHNVCVQEDQSVASSLTQVTGNSLCEVSTNGSAQESVQSSTTLQSFSRVEIEECVLEGMTEEQLEQQANLAYLHHQRTTLLKKQRFLEAAKEKLRELNEKKRLRELQDKQMQANQSISINTSTVCTKSRSSPTSAQIQNNVHSPQNLAKTEKDKSLPQPSDDGTATLAISNMDSDQHRQLHQSSDQSPNNSSKTEKENIADVPSSHSQPICKQTQQSTSQAIVQISSTEMTPASGEEAGNGQ